MRDAVVKIDKELLAEVEDFIKRNKYIYSSRKHLVTLAIAEFLEKNKQKEKKRRDFK